MTVREKYGRIWLRVIFLLYPIASLIGFVFPFVPAYFINRALSRLKRFEGHVDSVRITPFAIRVKINGLFLDLIKKTSKEHSLFISAESVEISIDWLKLWSGTLQAELKCSIPVFTFSKEAFEGTKKGNTLSRFDPGMEIILNKVQMEGGRLEFVDTTTDPKVLIQITNIDVAASAIPIGTSKPGKVMSDILLKAEIYGGRLNASMKGDIRSLTPDFQLNGDISDVDMPRLNDFFRAYGKFDIHKGIMGMHTEVTARDKKYKGYVESMIKDLQIMGPEDSHDGVLKFLWKSLIGTVAELLEDHSKDELAARVDFEAPFKNPEVHIGIAALEVLANALLHGLTPYMKNEVRVDL